MDIVALFCEIDDLCQQFAPWMQRTSQIHMSEVMTILVLFHAQGYRNLKQLYLEHVCVHLRQEFPHRVSYNRFVELLRRAAGTPG